MNRVLPTLLLVFLSAACALAQAKTNQTISTQIKTLKAEKYLSLDYNKSANFTKILAFGEEFGRDQAKRNQLSSFSFGLTFNYIGDTLTAPPETFTLTFWAKADKPRFAASHSLKVISGAETVDLGDARYATKASEKGMEYLNFVVSRENLRKVVALSGGGDDVRLMMGNAEFKFTPEHVKLFRDMLAISELS